MKNSSVIICLATMIMVVSCGEKGPSRSEKESAVADKVFRADKAPVHKMGGGRGRITAKANEETEAIKFRAQTAVLTNFHNTFSISLSDLPDDPVRSSGQFPPSEDDGSVYHRIVLTLKEVPTTRGQIPIKGLAYSVRDTDMHFNFGWSEESITGIVTIADLSGELPEEPGGVKSRPASIEGSFRATNKYGGSFSGKFIAAGLPENK